jgi:uncharacterized protein YjiS (DUF1127 family)
MFALATKLRQVYSDRKYRKRVQHTVKELSRLTDKELYDIGLCRGDIQWKAREVSKNV